MAKGDDNRLHRAFDRLLPSKQEPEVFLRQRIGDRIEMEYGPRGGREIPPAAEPLDRQKLLLDQLCLELPQYLQARRGLLWWDL